MIRVIPAKEPDDFDTKVRKPGLRALLELVGDPRAPGRPGPRRKQVASRIADIPANDLPTLWRSCIPQLRTAYNHTCAYLGMRIHEATGAATVDHYKPKSKHQGMAYEWSNFRLAAQQVNTNKFEHEDVLDPFTVENGWFELDIGTFQVAPAADLDAAQRAQVEATITRLKLNEPTFCLARQEYHDRYHGLAADVGGRPCEALPFSWLNAECPYVAHELERQGRLRKADGSGASLGVSATTDA